MLPDLTKDPDGGLTLLHPNTSPGPGREANWLPTPTGGVPDVPAPVLAKRSSPQRSMDGTQARKNLKQASPAVRKVASVDRSSTDSYLEVGTPYHRPERPEG